MSGERTEAPTPKRLKDARDKGDLPASRDLSTAFIIVAAVVWMATQGEVISQWLAHGLATALTFDRADLAEGMPSAQIMSAGRLFGKSLLALFAIAILCAGAPAILLRSIGWRLSAAAPKLSRINPASGMARMFSAQSLHGLLASLAKVTVLLSLALMFLWRERYGVATASSESIWVQARHAGNLLFALVALASLAFLAIGAADARLQLRKRAKRLAMTFDEVRRERRESDGSPEMLRARKERQFQLASGAARAGMQKATVVLVNPTHFAVALRYEVGADDVPVVVARGRGETAAAIRALAKEGNVPVLRYAELARSIYYTTRVGQPVASDLYIAVATVLAYVLNIEAALKAGRAQPEIEVPAALKYDADGRAAKA